MCLESRTPGRNSNGQHHLPTLEFWNSELWLRVSKHEFQPLELQKMKEHCQAPPELKNADARGSEGFQASDNSIGPKA